MKPAFCNVVEPGDRVVIVVNGFFGGRMVEIASRCGADVQRLDVPWGKPVLPEIVAQALAAQGQVEVVKVVHAETSTGVLSPIHGSPRSSTTMTPADCRCHRLAQRDQTVI